MQKQLNVCPYVFAKIKRRPKENQSLSVPQTCQKGKHGLDRQLRTSLFGSSILGPWYTLWRLHGCRREQNLVYHPVNRGRGSDAQTTRTAIRGRFPAEHLLQIEKLEVRALRLHQQCSLLTGTGPGRPMLPKGKR